MKITDVNKLKNQLQAALHKQEHFIEFPDINEKGKPLGTLVNTEELLSHYKIVVRYNEMKKEPEITIPNKKFHGDTRSNVQITWIEDLARQCDLPAANISEHIDLIANTNAYHPVREWIKGLKWDGQSRLKEYYNTVTSKSEMKELFMRKWALSIVAACFREDYQFGAEGVLTFLGGQAAAKTSWAGTLFPKSGIKEGWVITGCTVDPNNKDTLLIALSGLITEMGEMGTSFRKSDKESMKQFCTQKVDKLRPPYAAKVNTYSRRTVFFGTSSELLILNDTENRRFWPLEDVAFPAHKMDTAQFWAEMYAMYLRVLPFCDTRQDSMESGEWGWFLSPDERSQLQIEQQDLRTISPVIQKLEHCLEEPSELITSYDMEWLNATIICERVGVHNPNRAHANEAAEWLRASNYPYRKNTKKFGVVFDEKTTQNQYFPSDLQHKVLVSNIKDKLNKHKGIM